MDPGPVPPQLQVSILNYSVQVVQVEEMSIYRLPLGYKVKVNLMWCHLHNLYQVLVVRKDNELTFMNKLSRIYCHLKIYMELYMEPDLYGAHLSTSFIPT